MPFLPPNQQRQSTEGTLFTVQVETGKNKRRHTTRKTEKKHKNTYLTDN